MKRIKLVLEWFVALSAAAVLASIVAIVFVYIPVTVSASSDCLFYGYPNSRVTMTLTRYCMKRVDETDVVTPLSELQQ